MKNRTKYLLYVLLFGLVLSGAGCGAENSGTGTELRIFLFQSADEAEAISDEDLIYIAQNKYKTSDFISDIDSGVYDLFDTPLMEKKVDGVLYRESVKPCILRSKLPLSKVDVNEEISDEVFRELIDEDCSMLIEATNTWDGETGLRTKDEEILYCGENDYYVEYSIRYTELRTYYTDNLFKNEILVTHELPRAYRSCFLKNELSVENGNGTRRVYFGEMSLEQVKAIGDFYASVNSRPSIYRDVQETDTSYVYTNYWINIVGGDFGVHDEAILMKADKYYNKTTHEITNTSTTIKRVEISGTNVIYGK